MDAFHVVGAGGIGCAIAYALRRVGQRIVLVETDANKLMWGRKHGVIVDTGPAQSVDFVAFDEWRPPSDGVVFLCTKCYDNAAVLAQLRATTRLIPVQNGFDHQLESSDHEVEGISSFVSECVPGETRTRITRPGILHIGPRSGDVPAWLAELIVPLQSSQLFPIVLVRDIQPIKYTKLMYNAAISPLAAAAGVDNSALLRRHDARKLFFAFLRENYEILTRAKKPLGKVGPFHPSTVMKILERAWLRRPLAAAFAPSLRNTYCSMSGDIAKGRTEIGNYNGQLIEWAGDFPHPLNHQAVNIVERMTRERIIPHIEMLKEFSLPTFE